MNVSADTHLTPRHRLMIGALFVAMATGGFALGRASLRPTPRVSQPIAFDHLKHTQELEIDCGICHRYYETGEHSGLPSIDVCILCHEEPQTDSDEERRIVELYEQGQVNPFRKLFRMPDHVYYSHRRHVAIAGIACEECHGAIAESQVAPEQPLKLNTMETCLACHEKTGARSECADCHR